MNRERLALVLAHVKAHPEQWNQGNANPSYPCCFLSQATVMSGSEHDFGEGYTAVGARWLGVPVYSDEFYWLWNVGRTVEQVEQSYGLTAGGSDAKS